MLNWLRSKLAAGPRVKGYEIGECIFTGAFSNIYKSTHLKLGKTVALKILTESGSRIAAALEKHRTTLWEGQLLSTLDHPNIVKCVEYGTKPTFWLAMEFIESVLREYVGRCNNREEEDALLDVMSQLISTISYLHSKGLIHRDVCLGNILVDEDQKLSLIDFGLTIPVATSVTRGRAGTPSYMAPEMIRKWAHSELTDIYSFGVVMYELITGKKPFKGKLREQRMARSLNVMPPEPSRIGRHCAPELEELLMKCLEKDPKERFKKASEIQDALFLVRDKRRRG